MPYVSKAQRLAGSKMTLTQVIEHIRRQDGCDEADARRQMAHAIADRKVWPQWDDARIPLMGSDSLPILSDDDDSPTIKLEYWLSPEIDPNDPDRIREQRGHDPGYVKRLTAAKLDKQRRYRKPLFPRAHVLMGWPVASTDTDVTGGRVESRGGTVSSEKASGASAYTNNRTGPKPAKKDRVVDGMLVDYANEPDRLVSEKQAVLASLYGVSRDTAQKARSIALTRLRHNSGTTPT